MTPQREPVPANRNQQMIDNFRANPNERLLLLTTTGRKTGRKFTVPLVHMRDADRPVIAASKAGAPTNPDWYHNLVANPTVTVETKDGTFEATAIVTSGGERDRLVEAAKTGMPILAEHQAKTTRQIPIIVIEKK